MHLNSCASCVLFTCCLTALNSNHTRTYLTTQIPNLHCVCIVCVHVVNVDGFAPICTLLSPSSVFVINHASPDDFQPLSLREMHSELAANFNGARSTQRVYMYM